MLKNKNLLATIVALTVMVVVALFLTQKNRTIHLIAQKKLKLEFCNL